MKLSNLFKKKSSQIEKGKSIIEPLTDSNLKNVIGGVGVNTSRSNIKNQGIVAPDETGTTAPNADGTGELITP